MITKCILDLYGKWHQIRFPDTNLSFHEHAYEEIKKLDKRFS